MKVTVFTSNRPRHLALARWLAEGGAEVHLVQEAGAALPGPAWAARDEVFGRYFARVVEAEEAVFGGLGFGPAVPRLVLRHGELSGVPEATLRPALGADLFLVFGSSWIRGWLCDLLVARRAVNVHMGTSPFYRGSACNFWALRDGRADLVAGTVHLLARGLDSGPMLFHALPAAAPACPFELGMRAVEVTLRTLVARALAGELLAPEPVPQDRGRQLRYTRGRDFTPEVAAAYLEAAPGPGEVAVQLARRDLGDFVRPVVAAPPG